MGRAPAFGAIALLGSGETSPSGGAVFERLARGLDAPLCAAVLETPAGFQPNSAQVAGKVAAFLSVRLQNYAPELSVVPARKRGTAYSPDDDQLLEPLYRAGLIFLGPGSPTYAVRQLADSRAWHAVVARQRRGAAVAAASAATIALGALALPVYEIYKVGEELGWRPGLDLLGPYGLKLVLMPHWDNAEGGAELDTSRCFVGRERFEQLRALLPTDATVVGIDEHTGLVLEPGAGRCQVLGRGGVTILRGGVERRHARNEVFALDALGPFRLPEPEAGIPRDIWDRSAPRAAPEPAVPPVPAEVAELAARRQDARERRDWAAADELRRQIAASGWQIRDTPDGPVVEPRADGRS